MKRTLLNCIFCRYIHICCIIIKVICKKLRNLIRIPKRNQLKNNNVENRFQFLDGYRGFCAASVVIQHCGMDIPGYGAIGLELGVFGK